MVKGWDRAEGRELVLLLCLDSAWQAGVGVAFQNGGAGAGVE